MASVWQTRPAAATMSPTRLILGLWVKNATRKIANAPA